jgi:hypothetical protein
MVEKTFSEHHRNCQFLPLKASLLDCEGTILDLNSVGCTIMVQFKLAYLSTSIIVSDLILK